MLYVVTDFSFYMLPGATKGSFEFEQITSDQAREILKQNKYEVYMRTEEKVEADTVRKDLKIKIVRQRAHVHEFYENDKLILVQNEFDTKGKFKPKYFYCIIHSNGHRSVSPRIFSEH